ncbi:serine/threonine protein phosphatase [bacterium]|nr:MAG: serine/threonine protein phosphatase [bacterium]
MFQSPSPLSPSSAPEAPRLFAIGDIHGCLTALDVLLESLQLRPQDQLVLLGDYIDRGPDSRGVIERLLELEREGEHIFLRGNHESWMMSGGINFSMFQSWLEVGGLETLASYGSQDISDIPESHWLFIERTRLFYETDTHIFVHGASGQGPLETTGEHWLLWSRIYNIEPHPSGKRVICGHTSQKNGRPLDRGFAVCIDTHAYGGNWLTALEVNSDEVFQANQRGETRSGTLKQLGKQSS